MGRERMLLLNSNFQIRAGFRNKLLSQIYEVR